MKTLPTLLTILTVLTLVTQADDNKVARVIYSEASPICSPYERYLVASVIKNRIDHIGFNNGKFKTMLDVVNQKNAFECIDHDKNTNWRESQYIRKGDSQVYDHAIRLSQGDFKPEPKVHFFLSRGTFVPNNMVHPKYWRIIKVVSTKNFDFYSIIDRKI